WLRKGTKGLKSSATKAPPARRFRAKVVEEHGLKWFNIQKEAKYAQENRTGLGYLALKYPTICDTIRELGLGYVFVEPEECNLTLVMEFYANWDTSFGERTKIKIKGQVVHFSVRSFNAFLCTLVVDPSMYFLLLQKAPYLCGEYSYAYWERDHKGTHSTHLFSYLNKEARVWDKF
ncbi:hypothetical protein HAX54_010201, partial [Datura stramonium]|nr:hypothetical protein [Datura stramonium]